MGTPILQLSYTLIKKLKTFFWGVIIQAYVTGKENQLLLIIPAFLLEGLQYKKQEKK